MKNLLNDVTGLAHALQSGSPMDVQNSAARVVQKPGAVDELGALVEALGCRRVMLICGGSTSRGQLYARAKASLGDRVVATFERVMSHSSTTLVTELTEVGRNARIDGIVAVGGGSSSDTAKGIAILLAEGGRIEDHASSFEPPDKFHPRVLHKPKLPVIAVPTTLSAAEVTPGLGLRDPQGRKLLFWDVKLSSRLIVLDPEATSEVPAAVLATTGMNGLAHCAEGLYSRLRNPIAEALALHGLRLFQRYLPAAVNDPSDVEARAGALTAAHLSGMVISTARVGIHHATCHCLGARGGLSHGVANSIMLPHALAYNLEAATPALLLLAQAMGVPLEGSDLEIASAGIDAVRQLQKAIGVPTRLRDTTLDRALLPAIAEDTLRDRGIFFNPKRTETAAPILQLLESAW
jgi:alcohol dehydrogenase class IV